MGVATQMLQLPQFRLVERCADAELAYRAIGTGLPACLSCNQGNLHAPLLQGPGCNHCRALNLPIGCILTNRPDIR